MLNKLYIIFLFLLTSLVSYGQINNGVQPLLPEFMSQFQNVRDFTINNTLTEAYFTVQSPLGERSVIVKLTRNDSAWNAPRIASFSGRFKDLEPFLAPDGLKLYFASDRPLHPDSTRAKDYDIWYVQRSGLDQPWSKPINAGPVINSKANEFYPAITDNKNLYLTTDRPGTKGKDDIFLAKWDGTKYLAPASMGSAINSEGYEFNAFVDPDDSYMIFTGYNRAGGLGSGDLYMSYKQEDGTWSKATNLGSTINSPQMDYCPFVHASSGMLYFTSRRSQIKGSTKLKNMDELMKLLGNYANGNSRLYQVNIQNISLSGE